SALHTGAALYPYNMKDSDLTVDLTQTLIEEKITIWHSVPSMFSYFSNTLTKNQTFPQLRLIILGGEAVRRHEVEMLKKHYPRATMANIYGQTESTVNSISLMDRYYNYEKCLIGEPLEGTQIIIADEKGNPLETLETGEILVASQYTATGYWNRPETTASVFIQHKTFGNVYRTGDLGRQLADGTIEFLGRRDHQVKIRGYRVETGEIETNILQHTKISEAVLTLRENDENEKTLCAYYVSHEKIETAELRNFLLETLPDYMIPSHFTKLKKMPMTPGGKTDRNALPEPGALHTQQQYSPPGNDTEKQLTHIWADTLKIQKEDVGIDNDFFQMGGHSLRATIMVSKIHKQFDIKLPLAEVFKKTTIRTLSETITRFKQNKQEKYAAIEPSEKKEYYNLSAAQKRLYILQQMDLTGTAYNMPRIIPLAKKIDYVKLEEAFKKLIQRHESLRTSFHMQVTPVTPAGSKPVTNNKSPITVNQPAPVQKVQKNVDFRIEKFKIGRNENHRKEENPSMQTPREFFRSFDLSYAPLLRVGIVEATTSDTDTNRTKPGSDDHNVYNAHTIRDVRDVHDVHDVHDNHSRFILLDMHHIITDGTSLELLTKEFFVMYDRGDIPPLKLQYRDYAEWQNSAKQKESIKRQEEYWIKQYSGELPVLMLPTDFPRPVIQSFEGKRVTFEIKNKETRTLRKRAKKNETTLYMTIQAIFTIVLAKLSGQEDIIIGTPTAGRRHADLENIIGMFVNTLAMRNNPEGNKTVEEYLEEVKENTLKAFENQEYQFEELVERISVRRDTGRNPIFDVMLNLLNQPEKSSLRSETQHNGTPPEAPGNETINPGDDYIDTTSKFDLNLTGYENEKNITCRLEYSTKLFKHETITRFIAYFKTVMAEVVEKPLKKIAEIEIISEEERKQVLYEFNGYVSAYPGDKTIHEIFEEQAAKTPDRIAIAGNGKPVGSGRLAVGKEKIKDKKEIKEQLPQIGPAPGVGGIHESPLQHPQYTVQLTYRELDEKSNRLAHHLQSKGAGPGTVAAIMVERSIEMIIALLGILKTGCAYLPIDPDYPQERINYMLKDSNAGLVLVENKSENRISKSEMNPNDQNQADSPIVLNLENLNFEFVSDFEIRASDLPSRASNLAYVIYTSGSTGKP
ncbi:MAG: AMP-binding protein, partial [bacterium]|nr:AMP-binding protein [bacterium]